MRGFNVNVCVNMAEIEEINDSRPRDLLQRFVSGKEFSTKFAEVGEEGENIELSLGLSLNGRFGVDPRRGNNLIRASSVSNFVMSCSDEETAAFLGPFSGPLTRTCSLPAETEEEWRKRKELQSLRRLEAKRKRVEKMKNGRVVKGKLEEVDQNSEENGRGSVVNNGSEGVELKSENVGLEGLNKQPLVLSQGSIGSQGSGSSGISDFESQPIRGINKCMEARSPACEQAQLERKAAASPATTNDKLSNRFPLENGSSKVTVARKYEMVRNKLAEMPCVSTKGEGPDGKRIEGFLYRYKKGEEVKIVCVCHGDFLSPAEFVKHGGGGNVEHPLRHIVISPTSFCEE